MNVTQFAKAGASKVPFCIGRYLSRVPFSVRLGRGYRKHRELLRWFEQLPQSQKEEWVLENLQKTVGEVRRVSSFYSRHWTSLDCDYTRLEWVDWDRIPLVEKADLRVLDAEDWGSVRRGTFRVNTGGTSGEPLAFFHDVAAYAKEWAHMHEIWGRVGYTQRDVKLTFRGKNLGRRSLVYNAVHNEYVVNAYAPFAEQANAVAKIATKVRFIHGYPSSVFEFIRRASEESPRVVELLRIGLKGVLYGSEYPAPVYRNRVSDILEVPSVSWFGHSEFCVLAYEISPYRYRPMHTYGFAEAIPSRDDKSKAELIGTSYNNLSSPFVRYRTGDVVDAVYQGRLLESFTVNEGRCGEIIQGRDGERISLTAMIFGRHHRVFGYARFVQVLQERIGHAIIRVTIPDSIDKSCDEVKRDFDLSRLNIEVDVELSSAPHRTTRGKVPLRIPSGGDSW